MEHGNSLISLLVLNWNGEEVIEECIASLLGLKYSPIEIIVVDNASQDSSLKILEKYKDRIKVISNHENYGYSRGNNIGILAAKGRYIAVLNNDIVVEKEWLTKAVKILEEDEEVGIISCRQMRYDDRSFIESMFPCLGKDLIFKQYGMGRKYTTHPICYVIGANGASAIYRKQLLEECGGFDEDYYAYHEESDLCMRALFKGWKCAYVPDAVVYHRHGHSFYKNRKRRFYFVERSRYLFIFKNFPLWYIIKNIGWLLMAEAQRFARFILELSLFGTYLRARRDAFAFIISRRITNLKKEEFKIYYDYIKRLKKEKYIPYEKG